MLNFVEQDCRHQHRIYVLPTAFPLNDRLKSLESRQGLCPQGLQLINTPGEQLCDRGLRTMHTEATLEFLKLITTEIRGIRVLIPA